MASSVAHAPAKPLVLATREAVEPPELRRQLGREAAVLDGQRNELP
eukprot:CAMPEP_0206007802 /NCGR_PEP_ID=MMETSP1464-20131121/6199_1 /ASSEMBLY_ACC=CAM_ASM_001124 /TAXON_ID=119497 /ORGANISM="Exanthemachrysis gayraliae, Strain RCC1523" /LENGTH=45 /DNA_ID= /DNA_START= /DNA_END= /DNA_ORIENTATION=